MKKTLIQVPDSDIVFTIEEDALDDTVVNAVIDEGLKVVDAIKVDKDFPYISEMEAIEQFVRIISRGDLKKKVEELIIAGFVFCVRRKGDLLMLRIGNTDCTYLVDWHIENKEDVKLCLDAAKKILEEEVDENKLVDISIKCTDGQTYEKRDVTIPFSVLDMYSDLVSRKGITIVAEKEKITIKPAYIVAVRVLNIRDAVQEGSV